MTEDAELLRCYVEDRSEAAFAELVQRHLDLVYSAALRRLAGDTHAAADVTQQVFIALARQAKLLTRGAVLPGWLYATTRNVAVDFIRTEQRRRAREQAVYTMQELTSTPPAEPAWEQLRPVLDEVMDELSNADREAIVLRYFARRPFADIGAALRLTEDAARMRVDRALEKLRVLLSRRHITSTAAALAVVLANQPVAAMPAGLAATVTGTALSSATAAIGPGMTVVQFMTTSKFAVGLAGAALLAAALGTATYEARARQVATRSLADAAAETKRADGRLREFQEGVSAAEQALHAAESELAAATQAVARSAAPTRAPDPAEAGQEFLARHPEARELVDELVRAELAWSLSPLYALANVPAAQRAQLNEIWLRSTSRSKTVSTPDGPITLSHEATLTSADAEAQARALIGSEAFDRIKALGKLGSGPELAAGLASAVYRTEPLSWEQTERITRIFAAAGAGGGTRATLDWSTIVSEASAVLSPTQLVALTRQQRRIEDQRAVNEIGRPAPGVTRTPNSNGSANR